MKIDGIVIKQGARYEVRRIFAFLIGMAMMYGLLQVFNVVCVVLGVICGEFK